MTTATARLPAAKLRAEKQESQFAIVFRRFRRHRLAVLSVILLVIIFVLSLLAPVITTFDRDAVDIDVPANLRPGPPGTLSSEGQIHLLGVDHLGRDLFTRVLYAGRISLSIALLATLLSESFGVIVGAYAGFYGGFIDAVISRTVEFMLTIPLLPILLIISAVTLKSETVLPLPDFVINGLGKILLTPPRETQQVIILIIILVIFGWLGAARLMRGMALSIRNQDFVESLRAFGASDVRIIVRHVIPNGFAPIIVDATFNLGGFIITEAALSFLGLGVQDPTPTWGNMLNQSQNYMFNSPWLPLVVGIPLVVVSLAFNFVGDGLRDALDPRLKR